MFGVGIKLLLKSDLLIAQHFQGVFSSDTLPSSVNDAALPILLVANTDPAHLPGSHWVAIWINERRCGYFFDSYGFEPGVYGTNFTRFMTENCAQFSHQANQLQSAASNVCGQWCLYFCYWIVRIGNHRIDYQLEVFNNSNRRRNDTLMLQFVSTYFQVRVSRQRGAQTCICMTDMLRRLQNV